MGATAAAVWAALSLASGCGRYALASSHPPATQPAGATRYGDAASPSLPTTAPHPTTPGSPAPGAVSRLVPPHVTPTSAARDFCLGPNRAAPANAETSDDPSGFRFTVIVADRICFGPQDDFRVQLQIENTTDHPLDYDSNEMVHVFVQPPGGGEPHWTDADCTKRAEGSSVIGPAIRLSPHERQTLVVATYPGDPGHFPGDPARNVWREDCRSLHGVLAVYGLVRWCPPGTVDGDGRCDPDRSRVVVSRHPVLIRMG